MDTSTSSKWFTGSDSKDGARDLVSGMISGFFAKIVEYPFDTVKVLQQTQDASKYKGPMDVVLQTYRANGFLSLYKGLTSPLIGAMMENATLFVAYGAMKKALNVHDDPTLSNPVPTWKYLVAGGGSGICSAFVLTPVELVKCRMQVQQATTQSATSTAVRYKGPVDVAIQVIKSEGFSGLWKGNVSCLAREIPGNVAWFGTYEVVKGAIQRKLDCEDRRDVPLGWTAFSGACAGVMYWLVPFPADTVKSRIQTDMAYSSLSFPEAFKKILKEEGASGLYRGVGITCLRAAPSHALIFYFYELASGFLKQY